MNFAILILHFNTPEVTAKLCEQVPEAIVIDNGSDPAKRLKVKNRIIQLDKNYGFTIGWNKGMQAVKADAYWLMNSDIRIDRKSIDRIKEAAENKELDIFTPAYNCFIKQCQPNYLKEPTVLGSIEFTAPIIMQYVIDKIGYFDESFTKGYGVEGDYCYRARAAGFRVGVIPDAEFYHIGSQTIQQMGFKDYLNAAHTEQFTASAKKYGPTWAKKLYSDCTPVITDLKDHDKGAIGVYTTIFGNYDTLKPHAWSQINAKWVCVTDNPALKCEGWEIAVVKPQWEDNRKNAKWYKLHPWEVPGFEKVKTSIFIDGSMKINSESFIEWLIIRLFNDMLQFRHPDRNCIYEEAIVSKSIKYYSGPDIDKQIADYSKVVEPHSGLWLCGLMVRKHTDLIKKLMYAWWDEQEKYTLQDQISWAYVCAVNNFRPTTMKENPYHMPELMKIIPHGSDMKNQPANVKSVPEPKTQNVDRIGIINSIIGRNGFTRYLEIGMAYGHTFFPVVCQHKDSVEYRPPDPKLMPTFKMTSDEYFRHFKGRLKYDVVFIDGDHERRQVLADIRNALDMIEDNGVIVCHDTNPPTIRYTMNDLCFNAYQAVVDVWFDEQLSVTCHTVTLPSDQGNGVSVIWKSKKKFPVFPAERKNELLTYGGFDNLRKSDSGIWITEDELYKKIKER